MSARTAPRTGGRDHRRRLRHRPGHRRAPGRGRDGRRHHLAHRRKGREETADEVRAHGRRAEVAQLDLTRLPDRRRRRRRAGRPLGRLDVLVNNAGTGTMTPFLDLELDDVREVLDVDLVGPFLCAQQAARHMIRQGDGGRIVNVTSVHEHQPRVGAAPYCAAKGGLGLLTQVMALELAEHGITVNAVAPGEIATPMTGQEDTDVHTASGPACRWAAPATPARWPP